VNTENIKADEHLNINISIDDTLIFKKGDCAQPNTPQVVVRFSKEDIEDIETDSSISNDIYNIKNEIIDWTSRVAGGLDEAEFYCTALNIVVDNKGEMVSGETEFTRRYML
jgi:hypothetical protein